MLNGVHTTNNQHKAGNVDRPTPAVRKVILDCPWSFRTALRADLEPYQLRFTQAVFYAALLHTVGINIIYRISHIFQNHHHPILAKFMKALIIGLWSADISPRACLGEGLTIAHSSGIVVGGGVVVGKRCKVFSSVVLGGNDRAGTDGRAMPRMGDDLTIYTSAAILGPVTVGSGARVGVHAKVFSDVPAGATVKDTWSRGKGR